MFSISLLYSIRSHNFENKLWSLSLSCMCELTPDTSILLLKQCRTIQNCYCEQKCVRLTSLFITVLSTVKRFFLKY